MEWIRSEAGVSGNDIGVESRQCHFASSTDMACIVECTQFRLVLVMGPMNQSHTSCCIPVFYWVAILEQV